MVASKVVGKLLAEHGKVRNQQQALWRGEIQLPETVERFYAEVGPVDVCVRGYGNEYFFPSLARLWEHQVGYRWDSLSGEPLSDWDPAWIVVADRGGDPFIVSAKSRSVLAAEHGVGAWDPSEAFPDLNTMAGCIALLGSVAKRAGLNFTNSDGYIRPQYQAQALERLADLLGDQNEANRIVVEAGWL